MIEMLYIDLFCGAGGTSTGVEQAMHNGEKCAKVIACVNHDPNAIASHAANHPDALHFTEDIRTLEIGPLAAHVGFCRQRYPKAKVVLWASLECTNFSRAKGGQPRDADSRTLAEHLYRYIDWINPDYIQIENVEEFMSWGELDENGKPVSKDRGSSYLRWVNNIIQRSYIFDWKILNAANYGAYTSRKRYFAIFAKSNLQIVWPKITHASSITKNTLFGNDVKTWKPVREVLDLDNEGKSIFMREKPLCERTLERIYAGLIKFVAGGRDAFLVKYNSYNQQGHYKAPSIDEPCPTVAVQNRLAMVTSRFLDMQYGNGTPVSVDAPSPTTTTKPKQQLVSCKHFLMNPQFTSQGGSVDKPCFTLIARMDKMPPYLVSTEDGIGIEVYETDSPMTCKVKEFMAMYGIIDIKMRMLNIGELKRIMGFPNDYILVGTQAEQKKYIGNAVEVNMARVLCEALISKGGKL